MLYKLADGKVYILDTSHAAHTIAYCFLWQFGLVYALDAVKIIAMDFRT